MENAGSNPAAPTSDVIASRFEFASFILRRPTQTFLMHILLLMILSVVALVLVAGCWKPMRLARRAWNVRRAWSMLRWWERLALVALIMAAPFVPPPFDEVVAGVIIGRWLRRVSAQRTRRRQVSPAGRGRQGVAPSDL